MENNEEIILETIEVENKHKVIKIMLHPIMESQMDEIKSFFNDLNLKNKIERKASIEFVDSEKKLYKLIVKPEEFFKKISELESKNCVIKSFENNILQLFIEN